MSASRAFSTPINMITPKHSRVPTAQGKPTRDTSPAAFAVPTKLYTTSILWRLRTDSSPQGVCGKSSRNLCNGEGGGGQANVNTRTYVRRKRNQDEQKNCDTIHAFCHPDREKTAVSAKKTRQDKTGKHASKHVPCWHGVNLEGAVEATVSILGLMRVLPCELGRVQYCPAPANFRCCCRRCCG